MASQACSLALGFGPSCATPRAARTLIAGRRRSFAVSCKMRQRHLSSQQKRQQVKRNSRAHLPTNMNTRFNNNNNGESQASSSSVLSSSGQKNISRNESHPDINGKIDAAISFPEETNLLIENEVIQEHPNIHLEIATINDTGKNILLLNQARVNTFEELEKILSEKEALQAEINILEMKLAETDARIKAAAQEKINVKLLEDQIEKMKNKMPLEIKEGNSESSFVLELDALRKEISPLKDEMQNLNSKLSGIIETDKRVSLLEKEQSLLEASLTELQSQFINARIDASKYDSLHHEFKDMSEKVENLKALEKEQSLLEASLTELQSQFINARIDASKYDSLHHEFKDMSEKVENLKALIDNSNKEMERASLNLLQFAELQKKVDKLEASSEENVSFTYEKFHHYDDILQKKIESLEMRLQVSDREIHSHIELFQESVKEFQDTLDKLREEDAKRSEEASLENLPWEFWSRVLLLIDGWLLEKKISSEHAKSLREMTWKKDARIRDAYLACRSKSEHEKVAIFLKLTNSRASLGLHVIHIAAEMAPVAKVGGLGDVVSGLGKALQKKGHLVEVVLPKYDCMQYDLVSDLKALDIVVESYFDGQLFKNKIWVGIVEGLPAYFIEPLHPSKFFWRGSYYGEHDDFKRFSFFSRAALELLYQAGKRPDIIHCHDWQTAFVAPLYWDIYAAKGLNSARICFTCHNFEHQGTAPASELASCGLDVHHMNRHDRMQDNSAHDRVNPVKGAIVFSNIVTTVSPTYAQEVYTPEGGRGLHETLKSFSKKFVGILNGIDTDAWNPFTDKYISVQYNADDLQGKTENKDVIRKYLKLSWSDGNKPLVGCITRLVPQKGVHLIRHSIYRTLELGGQFVLLGSSPVPHIQREFEDIAKQFQSHPHVRLLLKYDDALSHLIYAASDMFIIPSMFEPCGLTQMIAMRYGSVPIARKTGGLNDSVFDVDDNMVPVQYRNGFTFITPDEQGLSSAMERAFRYYTRSPESWQQLIQKDMSMDFSWDLSASQYEELYERSVMRARGAAVRA